MVAKIVGGGAFIRKQYKLKRETRSEPWLTTSIKDEPRGQKSYQIR